MKFIAGIAIGLLLFSNLLSQKSDVALIHHYSSEELSLLLFENEGEYLSQADRAFKARIFEVDDSHPLLNVAGDFDGDEVDEIALFSDLEYTPNMNPHFTCSVVKVFQSEGENFRPGGTWFSTLKEDLNFGFVKFAMALDVNGDGLEDIALIFNDPSSEWQQILVLESSGQGFSDPIPYYSVNRNEFNFTALKFAMPGDFNGNGHPDIAAFYNYFGTAPGTKQAIFLFECDGTAFSLLPGDAYNSTKESYDFTALLYGLAGDYNGDGFSDVAVLRTLEVSPDMEISVFEGSAEGQMEPAVYLSIPSSSMDSAGVLFALAGDFAGDSGSDLMLFYDDPLSKGQEMRVFQSESGHFNSSSKFYVSSPYLMHFEDVTTVFTGSFKHRPLVKATTWKEDKKGAVSFTFDNGYRGAFEFGAAELEATGKKGTFYVFTDTSRIYDGELAPTDLVRSYKDKGHEIGSHTLNNSNLGHLSESGNTDSLKQVLRSSLSLLNERYDQNTSSLSMPFGSFRYETLEAISDHFLSARSSQYGYNLSTPYDFYALRSWPILSTTSPDFVKSRVEEVENYGYYLPLMYHDMTQETFDEASHPYIYSRDLFRETVQWLSDREVWVETNENICNYIRARNHLVIEEVDLSNAEKGAGSFSFVASCNLPDSLSNVELTLQVYLPDSWEADSVTIELGDTFFQTRVFSDKMGGYALFNCTPGAGTRIQVSEKLIAGMDPEEPLFSPADLQLMAFPNPFSFESKIVIKGLTTSQMQLVILDSYGRLVKEIALDGGEQSVQEGLDGFSPGLYVVTLLDGGIPVSTLKLLKVSAGN